MNAKAGLAYPFAVRYLTECVVIPIDMMAATRIAAPRGVLCTLLIGAHL